MTKARKIGISLLVTFLISCIVFAGCLIYTKSGDVDTEPVDNVTMGVSDALIALLGDTAEDAVGTGEVLSGRRLSQKLTVTTDEGVLAVSGTVTKVPDAFYPGSYEISFSKKVILSSTATVQVQMKVNKGEEVHVLMGDRDRGYTEYTSVIATEDNKVSFNTNILQDYTLSTTDVMGAQAAMANIFESAGY